MTAFVSLITATYARPPLHQWLLDELAYWFARSDWPADCRELLILNDCPDQELVCRVPGVRIINHPTRYPTLGDKLNALVDLARGQIILPQDDDDIPLPHRIPQTIERLGNADYWNPQKTWFENGGTLHSDHTHGVCHNASAFRAGKLQYPAVSGRQDMIVDSWAKQYLQCSVRPLTDAAEWSYVYRWGVSSYHLSGFPDPEVAYRAQQPVIPGRYVIVPRMRRDYATDCRTFARAEL